VAIIIREKKMNHPLLQKPSGFIDRFARVFSFYGKRSFILLSCKSDMSIGPLPYLMTFIGNDSDDGSFSLKPTIEH
jgi:hypothetical protein